MIVPITLFILAHQTEDLHPAFVIPSPDQARACYKEGAKRSKTKIDDYVRPWCRDLGKVRSANGWSFTASYALLRTPGVAARIMGHEDARLYNGSEEFEKQIRDSQSARPEERGINMTVMLYAWPGVTWNNRLSYSAKRSDVENVKFVLLVDGNVEHALHPYGTPEMVGSNSVDGSVTNVNVNTATVNTSSTSSATAYGSNGSSAWANGRSNSTSTVTYNSFDIEGFRAYSAAWRLKFPLYDDSGRPLVPKGAQKLVLKVIRPEGELSTNFNLADFAK